MVRLARALGDFGLGGAIAAIVSYLVLQAFSFLMFDLLPYVLILFDDTVDMNENGKLWAERLLRSIYGLSWFGGIGMAYETLRPSYTSNVMAEIALDIDRRDRSGRPQLLRLINLVWGPVWLLIGCLTLFSYTGQRNLALLGYVFDGKDTLFLLSVMTLGGTLIVLLLFDAARWVVTGVEG